MTEHDESSEHLAGDADEPLAGSERPIDVLQQPAQEIVDPSDPDSFEDRELTSVSGHDELRDENPG